MQKEREAVNAVFGRSDWFASRSRIREITDARYCFVWLMRNRTKLSLAGIGRLFPIVFDHSSMIHAVSAWEDLLATSNEHREYHEQVLRILEAEPCYKLKYKYHGNYFEREFPDKRVMWDFLQVNFDLSYEEI